MRTPGTKFLASLLIISAAGCGGGGSHHSSAAPGDTTAPTVASTNPINAATGVPLNSKIAAIFSEPMTKASFSEVTYTVKQGTTAVPGVVTVTDRTAVFDPTSLLAANSVFTATITTGVKDLAGNALAANKVWTFTTGTVQDTTAPTVLSTDPADGATGVASNRNVAATFNEGIDPATIATAFSLKERSRERPSPAARPP